MFKPEEIPADLPDEVKAFLGHLKPEPEALCQKRKRLLAELGKQLPSARGSLQRLLNKLRAALLAMESQAPFQATLAEDFSQVLAHYAKDPAAPNPPPSIVLECMSYMRERVEAMGMGPLLEAVQAASTSAPPR
ncbi:hypothetical protein [Archangium violaceum]|uniref:Uncharacterized protein n=1 Tax=Archangium violaceum Cb vi76 TaxID=1406225 RepID=A0A084T265_9BACT|nr:hypothetical protein [Archangium violaceum]KFA94800.1 hypothetical protein Q664_00050 [Archangium violaceum Cb vi76]